LKSVSISASNAVAFMIEHHAEVFSYPDCLRDRIVEQCLTILSHKVTGLRDCGVGGNQVRPSLQINVRNMNCFKVINIIRQTLDNNNITKNLDK